MNLKNSIFIVTGAEGSGKTRVLNDLEKTIPYYRFQYLATHEVEGEKYKVISWKEFQKKAEEDAFIFSYEKSGVMIGAQYSEIENGLKSGKPFVWEVDLKWIGKVNDDYPGSPVIMIQSSSFEDLYEHFKKKGKTIDVSLARMAKRADRINKAWSGIADHVVVNKENESEKAAEEIKKIIQGK